MGDAAVHDNPLVIIDWCRILEAERSPRSYTDLNAETIAQPLVSSHVNLGHVYLSLTRAYGRRVRQDTRRRDATPLGYRSKLEGLHTQLPKRR